MAAAWGIVARMLKQPIVLAYIVAGILLGAGGMHVIPNHDVSHEIATIGIIFLLFLVGLELDIGKIKRLKGVVLTTGLLGLGLTAGVGILITLALGYPLLTAAYVGVAAAFSSTAVVLKILSDRHDLSALYAKVAIGILLLQDVVAIFLLMLISSVGQGSFDVSVLVMFFGKAVGLLGATWLITRYLLGGIFFYIAKSTDLLFLTSIAWAFLFAIVADALGFSKEIGAFLAGISLATLPYNLEIIGKVRPLKDFFLIIFFVVLGLQVSWPAIWANLPLVAAIVVLVLFVKSFITSALMMRQGYTKRPAYLTGAAMGQMSEFSLLIMLLGLSYGHVSAEVVGATSAMLALTIPLNTYWNNLNRFIYPILGPPLQLFAGRVKSEELEYRPRKMENHVLMFGANRMGYQMLKTLERLKQDVLVVDHNPEVIKRLLHRGVPSVYGDIDDFELLEEMGLADAKMVISTVPNTSASIYLIEETRRLNPSALVITTADHVDDALSMYAAGADYVVLPHIIGGEQAAQVLEDVEARTVTKDMIRQQRSEHISQLRERLGELVL